MLLIFLSLTTSHLKGITWPLKFLLFSFPCPKNRWRVSYEIWLSFIIHPMSFLLIVTWVLVRLVVEIFQLLFQTCTFPTPSHPTTSTTIFRCQDFFILPGKQFHFDILTPSKAEDDGFETIFMYVMRKSPFTYLGLGWVMGRADIREPGLIWPI